MMSNAPSHDLIDRLTLGVATTLEKRPGVCDVSLSNHAPTERHKIISWEQRNTCMMPEDLRNFYLTTDGLLLSWKVHTEGKSQRVGRMELNPISELNKINVAGSTASISNNVSLADIDYNSDSDSEEEEDDPCERRAPHFDGRSRIFELDPCGGFGKVCLVYRKATPGLPAQGAEIWFLDRSLSWSFLAADFSTYYRLMLMHVGLPHWQYAFTSVGLPPMAKEWFNLYAPVRLDLDESLLKADEAKPPTQPGSSTRIDFGKVFRGKSDKASKVKGQAASLANKKKLTSGPTRPSVKSMAGTQQGRTKPWT